MKKHLCLILLSTCLMACSANVASKFTPDHPVKHENKFEVSKMNSPVVANDVVFTSADSSAVAFVEVNAMNYAPVATVSAEKIHIVRKIYLLNRRIRQCTRWRHNGSGNKLYNKELIACTEKVPKRS